MQARLPILANLAFLLLAVLPACALADAQGLERVKHNTVSLLKGGEAAGPRRMEASRQADAWCDAYLDVPCTPIEVVPDPDVSTTRSSRRAADLLRLAQAYADANSRHHRDARLLERVTGALDDVLDMYGSPAARDGNWYNWLIDIPGSLGALALLLEDDLPPGQLHKLIRTLEGKLEEMVLTGANASWEARNHIYLALLTGDAGRLAKAAQRVVVDVRYGSDDGVREDYAYLFHGRIPYAAGYGAGFVQTVATFIYLFDATPWAVAPEKVALIENLLLEHTLWFVAGDAYDIHIRGRGYESPSSVSQITEAMLFLSRCQTSRTAGIRSACKALIERGASLTAKVASWADELMESDIRGTPPSGFRFWPSAEMGAYNTDTFHVGFRQYSSRVQDYEFLTLKGGEGWNLAMGSTWIMRRDGSGSWYAGDAFAPGIDMEFLPTATSRQGANPVNDFDNIGSSGFSLNFGTSPFSGGCGWGDGGVSGFILVPPYGDIVARKSLHFFDAGYWAVGSGISATRPPAAGGGPVRTNILQWRTAGGGVILQASGGRSVDVAGEGRRIDGAEWLWVDGVGIVFAEPTTVWHRELHGVLTLWLDHGTMPAGACYAFAVLPAATRGETAAFAQNPRIRPVRADATAHVVEDRAAGRFSAVFFEAGSHGDYRAPQPLVVYHASGAGGDLLCLQDPLHRQGELVLELPLQQTVTFHEPGLTFSPPDAAGRVRVEADTLLGRIHRLGTGRRGESVTPVPREDLSGLHRFAMEARSTPEETVLTFTMPPDWRTVAHRISIHGNKGHHLVYLDEAADREVLAGDVVRYRWNRAIPEHLAGNRRLSQRSGAFRAWYETENGLAVDYFLIPRFNQAGEAVADPDFEPDRDSPQWQQSIPANP